MSNITVLGIDLAKNVFQLHGANGKGKCVLKKRLSRSSDTAGDEVCPYQERGTARYPTAAPGTGVGGETTDSASESNPGFTVGIWGGNNERNQPREKAGGGIGRA